MCNIKVMKNHHTVAPTGRELVLQNRYLVSYVSSLNPNTDNFQHNYTFCPQPCPEGSTDYRLTQCQAFDPKSVVHWGSGAYLTSREAKQPRM